MRASDSVIILVNACWPCAQKAVGSNADADDAAATQTDAETYGTDAAELGSDALELGSDARMNRPGIAQGCWDWRFDWHQVRPWQAARLRQLSGAHGRNNVVFTAG